MSAFLDYLDKSPRVGKLLAGLSTFLANQRGLPMLVGTVLTVVSAIVSLIVMVIIVSSPAVNAIWLLLCLPIGLLHLAVFIGFLGFMLATPLGQGYGD